MARHRITPQSLAQLHLTDIEHPKWSGPFAETVRCDQLEEDLFAARTVSGVLIAIVTFGALLGAFAVLIAAVL